MTPSGTLRRAARYAAANPAHTVRFTPEIHAKVVAISERTGRDHNQAVTSAIDGLDPAVMEIILAHGEELGFRSGATVRVPARGAGFAEAGNVFRLTIACHKYGAQIELRLDDSTGSIAIRVLVDAGLARTPRACARPTSTALSSVLDVR